MTRELKRWSFVAALGAVGCSPAPHLPYYPATGLFPDDEESGAGDTGWDESGDSDDEGGNGNDEGGGLFHCGNGVVEASEQCDEGSNNAHDAACTQTCEAARCGDGLVWNGVEVCDDANDVEGDGCNNACGSSGAIVWTQDEDFGDGDFDTAYGVVTDRSGFVYATGTFGAEDSEQIWTAKYTPEGDLVWWREIFGTRGIGRAITVDENQFPVMVGQVWIPASGTDVFVRKYDPNGDAVWSRRFDSGRQTPDIGFGAAADDQGNIYACGEIGSDDSGSQVFLRKFDVDGQDVWTQTHDEESADDGCRAVTVTHDGGVAVAGYVRAEGSDEIWIRKYDSEGVDEWTAYYGGASHLQDRGLGISASYGGGIWVAGVVVEDGEGPDVWLRKFGDDGSVDWTKRYSGPSHGSDRGHAVAVDPSGASVLVGASYAGFQDFDGLLRKYSPEADFWWGDTIDWTASGDDQLHAVSIDLTGHIVVAGQVTHESVDTFLRKYAP